MVGWVAPLVTIADTRLWNTLVTCAIRIHVCGFLCVSVLPSSMGKCIMNFVNFVVVLSVCVPVCLSVCLSFKSHLGLDKLCFFSCQLFYSFMLLHATYYS